jgi:hypothetical protein
VLYSSIVVVSVSVGRVAGGKAVEAVQQDDRPIVRGASVLALLPVVLPAQAVVLGAQTAAVEPQRC